MSATADPTTTFDFKVADLGLAVPEERYPALLEAVKRAGTRKRGLVTDAEFRRLATRVKNSRG